ncbi:MAG TPA: hypothetical protein VMH27_04830 [Puia sp.]|nr:hypothetical protein [Puia sp.]
MLPEIGSTVTPYPSRWSLTPQQSSSYLFYCTDTALLMDGMRRDFLVLAIPDPARDSTIGTLIATGENLAPYLLNELHQLNKSGIVIDLRLAQGTPTIRQDYQVTSTALKASNLPIVFLWDQYSADRAAYFTRYVEQFPGISWSITRGRPGIRSDCFTATRPTF